ncbi:Hypothetical predicted protein [Lecanosticta acicola]|uniref:Box C/D snoRNA protein 1 n=1 Tax=Lecanosticta acicola TaxID=111012 RepID=A0AAI9E9B1_9PEZI|nr:Hypothetical predicted protein [Lecanosticta acicola]
MSTTESLLSDLCTICYSEKPKYRCPRCSTQTCSLPCYKRHQQRASCSGKRDPAEYRKKSQLATPTGIDRDYNYLKGVELTIDHASRETQDRGIGVRGVSKTFNKNFHPDSNLQKYLRANNIQVQRAPRGMSRQKLNNTRNTKAGHIMWTVELVDGHGNAEIHDDCLEDRTLSELYAHIQRGKGNAEKRRLGLEQAGSSKPAKKRRLRERPAGCQLGGQSTPVANAPLETASDVATAVAGRPIVAEVEVEEIPKPDELPEHAIASMINPDAPETGDMEGDESTREDPAARLEGEPESGPEQSCSFYLLKPGTSTASKVLVPLDSNRTLTESLQTQSVLEFPTIYILSHAPDQLPDGFMLATEYTQLQRGEEEELEEAMKKAGSEGIMQRTNGHEERPAPSAVDANKILDMLKRDVTR